MNFITFLFSYFIPFFFFPQPPLAFPFMPLDLNLLVRSGDLISISLSSSTATFSPMLPSSARRHVPQRAAAGLQHAADGGHGHGARQLAPCRPAAGRAEEHGGDDYPDPRQGRRLDRGGDLVGLVPDHNLERTIDIFVLASSPYTYFGSAGHP